MKLKIIILLLSLGFSALNAQSYDQEWQALSKKMETGDYSQAGNFAIKHQKVLDNYPDHSAQLFSAIAVNHYNAGNTQQAEENYLRAYSYAKQAVDTTLKPISEYYLASFYHETNNLTEAEKYYIACMAGMAAIYGQSSREYTQIFFNYTILLVNLERYTQAKPYVEALLYYYKTLDGERSKNYLNLLNYHAIIYQNLAEYEKALEILSRLNNEQAILANGDTLSQVVIESNLGDVYRETGNYELAIFHLKKAKQEYFKYKLRDRGVLASAENNLALCYKATGDIKEAEESYNRTLAIYKDIGELGTESYCTTLSNKADLYRELGRLGEASELLLTALEIRKQRYGSNTENYANALSNLANVYFDAGYYREALEKNMEANGIYRSVVTENHQGYGNSFNNLSLCYFQLKDYEKARECKEKALQIIAAGVGKDHYRYASYLISACGIYRKTKEYAKLEASLKEALVLVGKNFGKNHDLFARAQLGLAELFTLQGKFESASPYYIESLEYYAQQINSYFDAMSEEHQISYFNSIDPVFESYNLFLLNYRLAVPGANLNSHIRRSLRYQLLLKSLLTGKSARMTKDILSSNDQELKSLYSNWLTVKNELINNYKSTQPASGNNELVKKASDLETALKAKLNTFRSAPECSYETVCAALGESEAAIEIFRVMEWLTDSTGKAMYGAYVLRKNAREPQLVIFEKGNTLEGELYDAYANEIENQSKDLQSYAAFYSAFDKHLAGISRIYLSADGVFHKINLAGVFNTGKQTYKADEVEVINVSNLSVLLKKNTSQNINLDAVLYGYPDYDYDFKKQQSVKGASGQDVAQRFGLTNLAKLPGTKTEVEEISKTLNDAGWKVSTALDEHASEANLRKVQSPKILHIATHGFYLKDLETEDKTFLGFESNSFRNYSMLRSGIILAGAGPATSDSAYSDSFNDGILTAYEASMLNLVNTDLVVLSACQTGLGDEMGSQGIAGLQRSFAIAGAKNIIMSLWPVDDEATKTLMISFYKHYSATKQIESSFKAARDSVRKQFSHPYFWAAFVLLKTSE